MRAALDACREYGQPPSWWLGLGPDDQALILADRRVRIDAERKALERAKREAASKQRAPVVRGRRRGKRR